MGRRLGHAACLYDRKKHVQVAQPQAAADPALPIDNLGHEVSVITMK